MAILLMAPTLVPVLDGQIINVAKGSQKAADRILHDLQTMFRLGRLLELDGYIQVCSYQIEGACLYSDRADLLRKWGERLIAVADIADADREFVPEGGAL